MPPSNDKPQRSSKVRPCRDPFAHNWVRVNGECIDCHPEPPGPTAASHAPSCPMRYAVCICEIPTEKKT